MTINKYAIDQLEPKTVWKNFSALCQIPRPSKKEAKITAFIKQFGESLKLETIVDSVGNVIIRKPATKGFENRKMITFQAHMDMVPQKNSGISHDFEKDPIKAYITEGLVKAENTTLGSDNGIGIAIAMSVLESKTLGHGPIEAFFTVDEETSMTGANALTEDALKGDILLNLDSEDEGIFFIGCAGGLLTTIELKFSPEKTPNNYSALELKISGLKGGHSGGDIHLQRGNSIKVINRLLWIAARQFDMRLALISGGTVHNAIPREANAIITIHTSEKEKLTHLIHEEFTAIKNELGTADPDVTIAVSSVDLPKTVMDKKSQHALLNTVYGCPNGVISMSKTVPGLVESSTNLAIITTELETVSVITSQRSSIDSKKFDIANMIHSIFELINAKVITDDLYPGWNPNPDSDIVKLSRLIYKKVFDVEPKITAVHAGLECGLIGSKYPNMDMISTGPTIKNAHSPNESVNIESVDKVWKFVLELLKQTPKKF